MNPNENPSSAGSSQQKFGHDEISARARELWNHYGQPKGRDDEIWHEAERTLRILQETEAPAEPPSGGGSIPSPEEVSTKEAEFESSSLPSPPPLKSRLRKGTGSKSRGESSSDESDEIKSLRQSGDTTSRKRPS